MSGIVPVISLLVVVVLSLLVVRVASIALALTGVSEQLAKFQARSAFTGAGFTTSESEMVVKHPVRRRIIMLLMLLGNAGFITAISSLILSFMQADGASGFTSSVWFRVLLLAMGLSILWVAGHSNWIDRRLSQSITWALKRWTDLEVRDYAELLHLSGDYAVVEMVVEPDDWLASQTLQQLRLTDEGVLVLGIEKPGGAYLGAPRGYYELVPNDNLLLYGPRGVLASLDERRKGSQGNWEHHISVEKQHQVQREEAQIVAAAKGSGTAEDDSAKDVQVKESASPE